MKTRFKILLAVLLVIVGAAAWYLGSPLILDEVVSEATVADATESAATGPFTEIDRLHWARGTATVYRRETGGFVLRFEEGFEAGSGPDLRVLLSPHPEPRSSEELGAYVELGELKGNIGAQNYEIPPDVDLGVMQSVVIYCRPFHVIFSTATLSTS